MPADDHADAGIAEAVSANLRDLRQRARLSLDELAKRSGVSRTMLHQVETGRSTPSISVLWKIAAGLGVPFGQLLHGQSQPGAVLLARDQAKLLFNANQTFSSRALFPFDGRPRQAEFYELRLRPGGRERADAHAPGTHEHLILARGSALHLTVGEQTHRLGEGDCLVFPADAAHEYHNPDPAVEAVAYLMMTYAGIG